MAARCGLSAALAIVLAASSALASEEDSKNKALCTDQEAAPPFSLLQVGSRETPKLRSTTTRPLKPRVIVEDVLGGTFLPYVYNQTTTAAPNLHVPSPISNSQFFQGAKILTMMLMPSKELIETVTTNKQSLGPDDSGSLKLKQDVPLELRITYLPDAKIGWSGVAGESDPVNIPHTLLTLRLPIDHEGDTVYQSIYSLTNDDTAMLIYRLGHGIPAKVSNLTFPTATPGSLSAVRRGLSVLEAKVVEDLGDVTDTEFSQTRGVVISPEINFGTEIAHISATGSEIDFKQRNCKAIIHEMRKLSVNISVFDDAHEGFAWMLNSDSGIVDGYLVEADLNITTTLLTKISEGSSSDISKFVAEISGTGGKGDKLATSRRTGSTRELPDWETSPKHGYNNGDMVWFETTVNESGAQRYLPPGVSIAKGEPGVIVNVRWQPAAIFGPEIPFLLDYNEMWIMLPTVFKGKRYTYPVQMLLDDDVAATAGVDFGLPKKLANMTFTWPENKTAGSKVHFDVNRHGRKVVSLDGKIGVPSNEKIVGVNDDKNDAGEFLVMVSHQFPWDPEKDRPVKLLTKPIFTTLEQTTLTDVKVSPMSVHPEEPFADWYMGDVLRAGYMRVNCDFRPSMKSPVAWYVEEPDPKSFAEWWKNLFPVLFM